MKCTLCECFGRNDSLPGSAQWKVEYFFKILLINSDSKCIGRRYLPCLGSPPFLMKHNVMNELKKRKGKPLEFGTEGYVLNKYTYWTYIYSNRHLHNNISSLTYKTLPFIRLNASIEYLQHHVAVVGRNGFSLLKINCKFNAPQLKCRHKNLQKRTENHNYRLKIFAIPQAACINNFDTYRYLFWRFYFVYGLQGPSLGKRQH